ncbi:unnamed protein product [Amoebophrya sp. A25]|nr:unnamed protein product [Amoebophrya sp. A25]|eukprot:GSA25T00023938001.1
MFEQVLPRCYPLRTTGQNLTKTSTRRPFRCTLMHDGAWPFMSCTQSCASLEARAAIGATRERMGLGQLLSASTMGVEICGLYTEHRAEYLKYITFYEENEKTTTRLFRSKCWKMRPKMRST